MVDKKTFNKFFEQREIWFAVKDTERWRTQLSLDNQFVRFIYETWYMDIKIRKIVELKIHLGDVIDYSKPHIIKEKKKKLSKESVNKMEVVIPAVCEPVVQIHSIPTTESEPEYNKLKSNIIMDKSKLKIASVKLINGGMKGLEVEYLLPSIKGNVQFLDIYKSKRKAPIHSELEDCFGWLPNYLLDICGYTLEKEERKYLVNATTVDCVKYGDKGIIISGKLAVLGGMKELTLTTPLIVDETEYPEFGKLVSIINGIYSETAEYLAGKKVMTDQQLVLRFNAKNEEFDFDSFKKMTQKEQREMATKILEEQGCMVFHNDEIEEEETTVVDATTEEKLIDDTHVRLEPFVKATPSPEKSLTELLEANDSTIMYSSNNDDDDFALPLVKKPVKESTAKRKTA